MDSGLISLLGILLALGFLIWGSYKQFPILILGPAASIYHCYSFVWFAADKKSDRTICAGFFRLCKG